MVLVVASKRRQVSGLAAVVALVFSGVAAVGSSDLVVADAVLAFVSLGSSFDGVALATALGSEGFCTVLDVDFAFEGLAADLDLGGACFLAADGFL